MSLGKWRLAAVLVEGIIFILLSFFKVRESIVNAIPANLKYGIYGRYWFYLLHFSDFRAQAFVVADESTLVKFRRLF